MLTLMAFDKMILPQGHDSRLIGTDATPERPPRPRLEHDVFVNTAEI